MTAVPLTASAQSTHDRKSTAGRSPGAGRTGGRSLQSQFRTAILTALVLQAALGILLSTWQTSQFLVDSALQNLMQAATARAQATESQLQSVSADLLFISHASPMRAYANASPPDADTTRSARTFLSNYLNGHDRYSGVCLLNSVGQETLCLDSSNGSIRITPIDHLADRSAEDYVRTPLATVGLSARAPFYLSDVQPKEGILRASFVMQADSGATAGLLALKLRLQPLLDSLQAPGSTLELVDGDGAYIAPVGAAANLSARQGSGAQAILNNQSGTLYAPTDRPDVLQAYAPIAPENQPGIHWIVLYSQPIAGLWSQLGRLLTPTAGIDLVFLALAVVLASSLTRANTEALRQLSQAARLISDGDWAYPLPQGSGTSETRDLAASVNVMTRNLVNAYTRLQHILQANTQIASSLQSKDIADQAVGQLVALLQLSRCTLYEIDEDGGQAHLAAYYPSDSQHPLHVDPDLDPVFKSTQTPARLALAPPTDSVGQTRPGAGSTLAIQLGSPERPLGWLRVERAGDFAEADITHVKLVTAQVSLALQNARLYADVVAANLAAQQANRAKSEFLSTMSHELRTPLNSILNFAVLIPKLLDQQTTQPGNVDLVARFADKINSSGQRLLALINDLLDLAKIEAGRTELILSDYAPALMLERIVDEQSSLFGFKQLSLALELDPSLPLTVRGDRKRTEQIVINLLSNAAKFTHVGGATIRAKKADEQSWTVEVQDTGVGVDPSKRHLIFEPFRQADSSTSRDYGGTGLGLSIVSNLCRMMGGAIRLADSAPGQGSLFIITLPIRPDLAERAEPSSHVLLAPSSSQRPASAVPERSVQEISSEP